MTAQEKLKTSLKRITRTGFFNFWRNGTPSLASVLVMTATLLVIGGTMFTNVIMDLSLTELKDKVDVNVTFITEASEEDIQNIKHSLESLSEVSLVTYISREDALTSFKERHANDQSILAALDELGENPLGASLNIRARDPSQYASIAEFLEGDDALSAEGVSIIERINYFQNKIAIDRLSSIIRTTDRLSVIVTGLLVLLSVLIAFNTIRLTIYMAREEIGVMRLVGASTSYIQGPFVVVGIIYGVVASILSLIIIFGVTYWLGDTTETYFVGLNVFTYYVRHFGEILLIIAGSGIVIGAVSSALAIRRYLKV